MELNPNHPVTRKMHDHWRKLAAVMVNRTLEKTTVITLDEVQQMDGLAITIKETAAGTELKIVEEGERLCTSLLQLNRGAN